ncbi:hypothetical protein predicted by Glimmer/Critica (plasmid) [Sinorhizobium fredii HH103]|uniref:Uncharacterized protein n=1 Tax=Sinorhizobium fredii (strain HH103) TaxID=1117943 RepID=G9AJF5_SINF1|nr:hypothetical protein predicted by Glimmer/Critica [Sinorhizobium fredii HH103]
MGRSTDDLTIWTGITVFLIRNVEPGPSRRAAVVDAIALDPPAR